jgi:hypothetical protein
MRQRFKASTASMLAILLAASGCQLSPTRPLDDQTPVWLGDTSAASVLPQVEAGDAVLVVRKNGREQHCQFVRADAQFMYGCRDPLDVQDLRELRFRKLDGRSTITLPDLRRGDYVTAMLRSGAQRSFRVETVDADVVRGRQVVLAIKDISSLARTAPPRAHNSYASVLWPVVVAGAIAFGILRAVASQGGE